MFVFPEFPTPDHALTKLAGTLHTKKSC